MINRDDEFLIGVLGVEFFDLGKLAILDVLVDDLVVFSAHVVDDEVLA